MADSNEKHLSGVRFTGRVKWFNNKSGYGFITVIKNGTEFPEGVTSFIEEDIFAHHSALIDPKQMISFENYLRY